MKMLRRGRSPRLGQLGSSARAGQPRRFFATLCPGRLCRVGVGPMRGRGLSDAEPDVGSGRSVAAHGLGVPKSQFLPRGVDAGHAIAMPGGWGLFCISKPVPPALARGRGWVGHVACR